MTYHLASITNSEHARYLKANVDTAIFVYKFFFHSLEHRTILPLSIVIFTFFAPKILFT